MRRNTRSRWPIAFHAPSPPRPSGGLRFLLEVVAIVAIVLLIGLLMPERKGEKTCASIGGAFALGCD